MIGVLPRDCRSLVALTLVMSASGCVGAAPSGPVLPEPVRVSNAGQPFAMWEGAAARKAADAACGGAVNVSIFDRFDRATGDWVYPEGCA